MVVVEIFVEPVDLVTVGTRELLPALMDHLLMAHPVEFVFESLSTGRTPVLVLGGAILARLGPWR
jgi:hypothetical protein